MTRRHKLKVPKMRLTLSRYTRSFVRSLTKLAGSGSASATPAKAETARGKTIELSNFGSNPGKLRMFLYTPVKPVPANSPLIVVLHGCGQQAESFASNAGWVGLANHFRLPLVLPEQVASNNAGRCFNWYRPSDTRRGCGEAMSVRQMLRTAMRRFSSDRRRIFVVGLSAGGALTAELLAAYPAVFNAGAVVAGMPVGAASHAASALLRMHRANPFTTRASLVTAITSKQTTSQGQRRNWPRISIWHGDQDRTIDPENGTALAAQWSALHGFEAAPDSDDMSASGIRRRSWGNAKRPSVEWWTLPQAGHGFPIDAETPGGGRPAFGVIDARISAAYHIAGFWGLKV
jgi:poly(hydroxyalkanoate) depolymerase family esterase